MTHRIVILGGGTGGTLSANRLRRLFPTDEAEITVVDQDDRHVYQPGLLFVPFGLTHFEEIVRHRGFVQLHKAAVAAGTLSAKVKELMALAIAVVKGCDGCIAYHAKAAARRGATPAEVGEALGVALRMDGGTASVYGPRAWDAYREFAVQPAVVKPVAAVG